MGQYTEIAWCDHTWSPWIGCTEVSPGCDACYARALDARHKYGGATHWGAGVPRYRVKDWTKPRRWNAQAAASGKRWTVFPSLCDPFDNEVPDEWFDDFWRLINLTPNLTWLLLTKRIGNVAKRLPTSYRDNVWIGASVVNQEEADRDIPKLLATSAAKRFVSYEPALGPVDFARYLDIAWSPTLRRWKPLNGLLGTKLDQIIIGGESRQGSHKARPFRREWAQRTVEQCRAAGVSMFVKQMGSFVVDRNDAGFFANEEVWAEGPDAGKPTNPYAWPNPADVEHDIHGYREEYQGADCRVILKDRAGADPAEWPEDLRVQEFP